MEITNFGARLRKFRMARSLSLQKLADAAGVSKAHIYELETNRSNNPSLALLMSLSRELAVSIKDLVGETGNTMAGDAPQLAPLFRDLRSLTEADLEIIRTITEKLREKQDGKKSGN